MTHKRKLIYLNEKKSKFCIIKLFDTKKEMQDAYAKFRPDDTQHYKCLGAHCAYEKLLFSNSKRGSLSKESGTVFLSKEYLGAGIVTHELMHAVLWAYKHKRGKKQYPIIIKSMKEEEEILHNHTYAVKQFYNWLYTFLTPT
jgi:hypothetical protein